MPIEIKTCIECGRIYPEIGTDLNHFCNYDAEILYTQAELDKAVEVKSEECAKICEELDIDYDCGVSENYQCAEAIRGK